jgi:hypothetical protein
MNLAVKKINDQIEDYKKETGNSVDDISDGYHSFGDLYKHRTYLLALAMIHMPYAWKARVHEDGTMFDDMFVVGFPTPAGMVTYHCDNEFWNDFKVPVIPHAPHFDGYSDKDVLDREKAFLDSANTRLINGNNIEAINKIVKDEILPVFDNPVQQATFISFYTHEPVTGSI